MDTHHAWFLVFALVYEVDSACGPLPSGFCFVDCTQAIPYVVCENVTDGNDIRSDLYEFSGLNTPFELYIWNCPRILRLGSNIFEYAHSLLVNLELENFVGLNMFPELQLVRSLRHLAIRNAPQVKSLSLGLLPDEIEEVVLQQTGITQFVNKDDPSDPPMRIKRFVIEKHRVEYLTNFFWSLPDIQNVEVIDCRIVYPRQGVAVFRSQKPLTQLRLRNNTFEAAQYGKELDYFRACIQDLNVNENSSLEITANDMPIGRSAIPQLKRLWRIKKLVIRGSIFADYSSLDKLFEKFVNLEHLDLGESHLPALRGGIFTGLRRLKELRLAGNGFDRLEMIDFFAGMTPDNLTVLDLSGNHISEQPFGIENIAKNLRWYNLDRNAVSTRVFYKNTWKFPNLQTIKLNHNPKPSFTASSVTDLTSLQSMDSSCNLYRNVTWKFFAGFPRSLKFLNYTFCCHSQQDFVHVENDAFTKMTELETLILGSGYLKTSIFYKLQAMPKESARTLRTLDLRFNSVAYLPEQAVLLKGFTGLRYLVLKGNELQSLGNRSFANLPNLTTLELGFNAIFSINPDDFTGLDSLKELNLQSNNLILIQPGTFDALPNLEVLMLTNNNIPDITPLFTDSFGGNLVHLSISGLPIPCLNAELFSKLYSLKWIYRMYSPIFLDADPKYTVAEQAKRIPVHRWPLMHACDSVSMQVKDLSSDEKDFVRLRINDPGDLVYQDLYAHFARCYQSTSKQVHEKVSSLVCPK